MTEMTPKERALYDAQADHEAWSLAHEILEPWVQTTKPIGSDELTRVMEGALSEVAAEVGRTLDVLENRQRGVLSGEAERDLVAEILRAVNGNLAGAIDRLDGVPPEAFGSEDDYFKAKGAIAEAGQLVARAERRVFVAEENRRREDRERPVE